jgi:PAS domain S-box-containing protein
MQDITHREDLAQNIPLFERAVAEGTPFIHEKRYIRPDGGIVWVSNSVSVIRSPTGEPYGVLAVSIDVTERRRAEQALRASETRLRLAVEAGQLGEWELDLATDTSVRAFRHDQIFGYDEPLPDWGFDRFIAHVIPEDREHVESAFRTAAETGSGWHFECRIRRANDGQIRWIEAHGEPQVGRDGKVRRMFGIVSDITEQREPHDRLRRLLDQLFAFVGVVTTDGLLIEANRAPLKAAGIEAEDVLGKHFWEAYWWSYDPAVQARLREAIAEAAAGELVRYDVPVRMAGGALVTIDFQISPLRDSEGTITHLIPSGVVVEERVRAEAELRRLNAELEQRVATAIAEREQAQEALRQSQKLEAMGQLTGGVAHDFNNLLSPIIGGLDLLQRRGVGDERTQRTIGGALASAERAKTLVQRLLAFARRQPLQPTPVDLNNLVAGMAELVASTSGPRVKVRVELPPEMPPVKADPNQLEMAILNLAVNARDAMPDGGSLTISAFAEDIAPGNRLKLKAGRYVRLCVADTGVGMDEAVLARAIEPFFSTKGIGKGTGLGLSMVHGLAAQLGGGIEIRSRPGVGTNIELYLPVADALLPSRAGRSNQEVASQTGTALLVDDEELVRASTADMLGDLGYRVIEAASAEDALKRLGEAHVDVVVTDHLMPGMTGTELAREVQERRPGVPVLVISGYADVDGIAPHLPRLTKPFRQADLAASLAAMLGQPQRANGGAP